MYSKIELNVYSNNYYSIILYLVHNIKCDTIYFDVIL